MFLRHLSLLCLCSSSLFATSFTLDVACTIKDDTRHIQINNMKVEVDEYKPCILALEHENIDLEFSILKHTQDSVAVETIITQRATENSESSVIAKPMLVVAFGQPATITCTELKTQCGEKETTFELKLLAHENN
jgi:hypothetical protein